MVPYSKLVFTLADSNDKMLFIGGMISSALCGAGLPSFVFLFGDIADSFEGGMTPDQILESITHVAKILSIIGSLILLGSYLFYVLLSAASERIG